MLAPLFARATTAPGAPAAVTNGGLAEARRRFAVRLILLIYILSLVEGPLRKWFLPELATPVYFVRDPFVLLLYAYCLQHRLFAWGVLGRVWVVFALATSVLALVPFAAYGINLLAWPLGIRTYWLWMPLAFAVAGTFRRDDVERLLRWNVLLAVPYALLVANQYGADADAWINRGVAGDEEAAVRPVHLYRPQRAFHRRYGRVLPLLVPDARWRCPPPRDPFRRCCRCRHHGGLDRQS